MDSIVKKEGFFKPRHLLFCKSLSENDINSFTSLRSDEDRFNFVFQFAKVHDYPITLTKEDKSEIESKTLKESGNKKFQAGEYVAAFQFYTQAILKSPLDADKKEYNAVLRANRSAVLYHVGRYKEALKDIATATALGYPKELMHKIKDRKARCLLALKQHNSALQAFRETLQALDDSKIKVERRQKWQRDVQIMITMISKTNAKNEAIEKEDLSFKDGKRNPVYRAANSAVDIKQGEEVGRYAEAKSPIKIGELILSEEAHCAVLLQEYAQTHCFQCFKRLVACEPCPTCCKVAFCSEACSRAALSTHHQYECPILQTLWASGASVTCLMALRIVAQKPPTFFTQLDIQDSPEVQPKEYEGSDYKTIYHLVRHEGRREPADLLHRAHMAVFLFRCLKESGYFEQEGADRKEEEAGRRAVGGLLLRHLQLLQFNAHEVSEMQTLEGRLDRSKSVFLGGALYPTLALFNHSCNPSLTRYFQGTRVIARAIRNLKKGELIAENYGPIFTQVPKKERQGTLSRQYWFDCRCEACTHDWPVIADMDPNILRFHCEAKDKCDNVICIPVDTMEFMVKCNACSTHINILKGLKALQDSDSLFRIARSLMDEGKVGEALKKFSELLSILDETLAPPFKDYHLCQQAIRTCFLALGNKYDKGVA